MTVANSIIGEAPIHDRDKNIHWGGGGCSYIHVLPYWFLFKLINLNLI